VLPDGSPLGCAPCAGNASVALLRFGHDMRRDRQLQHRRVLAFAQPVEQHDLPARELERIVMRVRIVDVDLSEGPVRNVVGN
jgi:hypothetical protein